MTNAKSGSQMKTPRAKSGDAGQSGQWLRSTGAVVAGFVTVLILSLGTDQVLHSTGVYPPWGEVMQGTGLYVLALTYRIIYTVIGGYITARLAPYAPVRHALILAIVGLVVGTIGAAVAITAGNLGPSWYPIAVALTGFVFAWLGGVLYESGHPAVSDRVKKKNTR